MHNGWGSQIIQHLQILATHNKCSHILVWSPSESSEFFKHNLFHRTTKKSEKVLGLFNNTEQVENTESWYWTENLTAMQTQPTIPMLDHSGKNLPLTLSDHASIVKKCIEAI